MPLVLCLTCGTDNGPVGDGRSGLVRVVEGLDVAEHAVCRLPHFPVVPQHEEPLAEVGVPAPHIGGEILPQEAVARGGAGPLGRAARGGNRQTCKLTHSMAQHRVIIFKI